MNINQPGRVNMSQKYKRFLNSLQAYHFASFFPCPGIYLDSEILKIPL